MTNLQLSEIAIFATRNHFSARLAATLPAIFEKVAETAGQPVRSIISQATYSNQPLADYIKEIATKVA